MRSISAEGDAAGALFAVVSTTAGFTRRRAGSSATNGWIASLSCPWLPLSDETGVRCTGDDGASQHVISAGTTQQPQTFPTTFDVHDAPNAVGPARRPAKIANRSNRRTNMAQVTPLDTPKLVSVHLFLSGPFSDRFGFARRLARFRLFERGRKGCGQPFTA
jgi:hypothetical protein